MDKILARRMFVIRTCLLAALIMIMATALPDKALAFGAGSRGPDVFAVQGMLKSLGYYGGAMDGIYGNQMAAGVREFQRRYGLPMTGAVDNKTLESILWAYGQLKTKGPAPTPAPTPTKPPTPAPKPPETVGLEPDEQLLLELVNRERASRGIKTLTADLPLSRVAELKSKDMVERKYFSHQSPVYGSPFDMMKQFGITYRTAGENIACNQSVEAAHKALMESQGHRENILNASYTHIGIGIVSGGPCGKMFTEQFIGR